jgi:hypothetical protein
MILVKLEARSDEPLVDVKGTFGKPGRWPRAARESSNEPYSYSLSQCFCTEVLRK